jgi:hypothetical protein
VAAAPDYIDLERHRDLRGRHRFLWMRRAALAVLAAFLGFGLANVFGERPSGAKAAGPTASLTVYSPTAVRGGLYFEGRFDVRARRELKDAQLVLDTGWLEGMTLNTIEPSPLGEASRDGKLALDLGHVAAGHSFILYIQAQVNPTNVGRRSIGTTLYDGSHALLRVNRTMTIFP